MKMEQMKQVSSKALIGYTRSG